MDDLPIIECQEVSGAGKTMPDLFVILYYRGQTKQIRIQMPPNLYVKTNVAKSLHTAVTTVILLHKYSYAH